MADDSQPHDLYQCSICLSDMMESNPRALGCLHTFCQACLEQFTRRTKQEPSRKYITCPICRQDTPMPPNGVGGLPINFVLRGLYEKSKDLEIVLCQLCESQFKENATFKCVECEVSLCSGCREKHVERKLFAGHTFLEIFSLKKDKICQRHKIELKYYCSLCHCLACVKCVSSMHDKHESEVQPLDVKIQDCKHKIEGIAENIKSHLDLINSECDKLSTILEQIRSKEREIALCGEVMKAKIDEDVKSQHNTIRRDYRKPVKRGLKSLQAKKGKLLEFQENIITLSSASEKAFIEEYFTIEEIATNLLENSDYSFDLPKSTDEIVVEKKSITNEVTQHLDATPPRISFRERAEGVLKKTKYFIKKHHTNSAVICAPFMAMAVVFCWYYLIRPEACIRYDMSVRFVTLPTGGVVVTDNHNISMLNFQGVNVWSVPICSQLYGSTAILIRYKRNIFVIKSSLSIGIVCRSRIVNGTLQLEEQFQFHTNRTLHVVDGVALNESTLLLLSKHMGLVFQYDSELQEQVVLIRGFDRPTSISCSGKGNRRVFAVVDEDHVYMFDYRWRLHFKLRSRMFGGSGFSLSPWRTLIVSSRFGFSEYHVNGSFYKHYPVILGPGVRVNQPIQFSRHIVWVHTKSELFNPAWYLYKFQIY